MGHKQLDTGDLVTCRYRGAHVGVLLAENDPRAWVGSIAFDGALPTQAQADAHITWCHAQALTGYLRDTAPVLWPWGVMWDKRADLLALPICKTA